MRFGDLLDDRRHSFLEPFLGSAFYRPLRRVCSQCGGNACCGISMTAGQEDINSSQWNMGHTGVYNYMGYTMRTAGWRFTAWLPFDNSNATVIWPELVDMGERWLMPALSCAAPILSILGEVCSRESASSLTVDGIGQASGWSSTTSGPMTVKKTLRNPMSPAVQAAATLGS